MSNLQHVQAEQLIADALEQGKQLVEQHSADDHESQKSAESEAAVDDLLAADDEPPSSSPPIPARSLEEPASSGATVMPIEPVASSRSTSMDRTTLLEQAKLLLVPIIAQNARRRDPDADPKALEERVMSLVTDEQCLEFLRLARESQTQMKGGTTAASDGTGETEVGEVKLEGHMAPRGSEAAGMADGVEATDVASAQAVQSPGTKRQRTPMAELAESSRPRKTPRPTSGSDDSTSGHQDARVSHDRTKDSGLASTSRPSPAVAEHELGKEPPTAPRALSDAPRDLPSRPGIQMKVADAPVIISPRNKSTQGKSSLPTDRRSTGSAVTGSRTGDERHAASVANLDAPRLNELKRTASCAESEDMDVDPNADPSPGRQSPVLDQSQDSTITLASVSAEPTDAPPSSVTAVSQDGTPHTPVEVKDLAGTVTSLPSPDHSRGAQQDQPSPVETQTSSRATLSNAAAALARPPISHAESSTNRQASNVHYSQTHTSTLDANLSDKSSSLLSVSTGSLLSDNGEASAELLSRQPNTERAIPSSESHIPGKSGPHDNLGLTNVASDPDRGDRSAARAQDTSSGRNNNEDLPSANKSQQQEILSDAEASPSVEARQSLPLSANPNPGSSVVTNGSTPVANTDIVSSTAATFAPAVSPPSPLAQPASSTRDSRRIDDDISAPPDAVLADDHRSISSAITQRPDHNTVPMEVDPAVPTSSSTASKPPPTEPEPPAPLRIPGLYFAEVGKNHAAVYNVTFHVDDESAAAAKRWSSRATTTEYVLPGHILRALTSRSPSASYTFRLLCLHVSEVQGAVENGQSASPEEFATALWQMKTRWPPRGQLIVEMNNESDARGSWLPRQLVRPCMFLCGHIFTAV